MLNKFVLSINPFTRVNDKLSNSIDQTPLTHDVISTVIPGKPNDDFRYQAEFYSAFGVDVVTETVFDYPYPYVTEKTLRPIASKRPFIVIGASGILQLLKSKEFLTYSNIIDESYDDIQDHKTRFDAVCESVKKFVEQPIEKIKQDIEIVAPTIEHNFKILKNLEKIELELLAKKLKKHV